MHGWGVNRLMKLQISKKGAFRTVPLFFHGWLEPHYQNPQGWLGRYVGHLMTRQHTPERQWTVEHLALSPTARVLEVGFGAGQALLDLLPHLSAGHLVGVDRSATMVALARRRLARWVHQGRVQLIQGDLRNLPCPDAQFDIAFTLHTVYFWSDIGQVVREFYRVLAPGGQFMCIYTPGESLSEGTPVPLSEHERHLLEELERVGFTQIERQSGPRSRQFAIAAISGIKPLG